MATTRPRDAPKSPTHAEAHTSRRRIILSMAERPEENGKQTQLDIIASHLVRIETTVSDGFAEMRAGFAETRSGFDRVDRRLNQIETRIEEIEPRTAALEKRVSALEA